MFMLMLLFHVVADVVSKLLTNTTIIAATAAYKQNVEVDFYRGDANNVSEVEIYKENFSIVFYKSI